MNLIVAQSERVTTIRFCLVLLLFSPVQDEKNQILTTNAWLNLVSLMWSSQPHAVFIAEQTVTGISLTCQLVFVSGLCGYGRIGPATVPAYVNCQNAEEPKNNFCFSFNRWDMHRFAKRYRNFYCFHCLLSLYRRLFERYKANLILFFMAR